MHSRLINNYYNKCTKDYYRLKYLYEISKLPCNNIKDQIDDMIINVKKINEKENPYLFKLPYSICSLENTDENKENIYKLYKEFINLSIDKQIKLMLSSDEIDENIKNSIKNI